MGAGLPAEERDGQIAADDLCKRHPAAAALHKMFAGLPENTRRHIVHNLESMRSPSKVVRIGSLFTGSNVEAAMFSALEDLFVSAGVVGLKFCHRYACERDPRKQDFLTNVLKPDLLFQDAGELASRTARDVYTGQEVEIPEVDIGIAGFVCKTLSTLNFRTAHMRRKCIPEGQGKSGKTWFQVRNWLKQHQVKIVLLENVPFTMFSKSSGEMSNFAHVRSALESLGYRVNPLLINCRDHGVPQSRVRIYIVGVLRQYAQGPDANIQSTVDAMRLHSVISLEHFLMTHVRVVGRGSRLRGSKRKWMQVHSAHYQRHDCLESMDTFIVQLQERCGLTDREASVLNFHYKRGALQGSCVLVDLKHSIDRTKVRRSILPCLLPGARILLHNVGHETPRLLLGAEMLMVQGLSRAVAEQICSVYDNRFLIDLAGNAFSGVAMAAVFLGAVCAFQGK